MSSKVAHLAKQGFISPPEWLPNNIMYETIMGSIAYGVSNEWSDADIYDVKFAYHVVRLISEVEQILSEGDLDLQRNREQLNSIRQGEWTEEEVKEYFARKEAELENLYHESNLPYSPDEDRIKNLLLECLEEYYGSLDGCVVV